MDLIKSPLCALVPMGRYWTKTVEHGTEAQWRVLERYLSNARQEMWSVGSADGPEPSYTSDSICA